MRAEFVMCQDCNTLGGHTPDCPRNTTLSPTVGTVTLTLNLKPWHSDGLADSLERIAELASQALDAWCKNHFYDPVGITTDYETL